MKKIIILLVLLINLSMFAQTAIDSEIKLVTVFKQQAEVTREVQVNLITGTQEIILTGISTRINPSSLQTQIRESGITLLSVKYERNYLLPKKNNPEIEKLQEKLQSLEEELSWIVDQKTILHGTLQVLNKNQDLGGESGFTPNQVIELANAYKTKSLEIRKEVNTLLKQVKKITKEKKKIKNQLNEKNAKFNTPSGNIVMKIDAKSPKRVALKCTYAVSNAGWTPLYDLRSSGITKNVKLNYKANVHQNTGQDWTNVVMVISTGNPSQNNNRPILSPLYAQVYENNIAKNLPKRSYRSKAKKESIQPIQSNMMAEVVVEDEYRDGFNYNAAVTTNQINIAFKISNKQEVKSDGKNNLVALASYELDTKYIYHAVPKISSGAYLLAKVSDWGKHNLESGEANIFFEGAYIGKIYINTQVTTKELLVSMGRDNGIIVERKPIKEYKSSKFIGTNKKETFGYDIIVKNKKTVPIEIEVLDQIPVSQNKQIKIELEGKGNAVYKSEIGKLLWRMNIKPQQTVKDRFVYSVKYPKKETITGIK